MRLNLSSKTKSLISAAIFALFFIITVVQLLLPNDLDPFDVFMGISRLFVFLISSIYFGSQFLKEQSQTITLNKINKAKIL